MIDRRRLLLLASVAGLSGMGEDSAHALTPSADFTALVERIAREQVLSSPETLTSLGLDTGNAAAARSRLDDRSPARLERDRVLFKRAMDDLQAIEIDRLSADQIIHYRTLAFMARTTDVGFSFPYGSGFSGAPYVVSQLTGAHQSLPNFLNAQHPIETRDDADAYLARLAAFGQVLDQETERLTIETAAGAVPPDFILDRTIAMIDARLATPARHSGLVGSLAARTRRLNLEGDWEARAERSVAVEVYPALSRQAEMLRQMRATASHEAGVWRLPRGEEYYRFSLRSYVTQDVSPAELHQMGMEAVARYTDQADMLFKSQGMSQGSVADRFRALNFDPAHQYPNNDEGRTALLADLNAQMQAIEGRLSQYFAQLPRAPVEIRRVPEANQGAAPGGYYEAPTLDGSRPGTYYINLANLAAWPKWKLPTLTYHEASPGHHLQTALQLERGETPLAIRILVFSAYAEGWALYAEQLADEMGMYEADPWARLGYIQSLLFRSARLVVDTGLHHERWSRERALQYMGETLGGGGGVEIDRYCVLPGQACSYKVGHSEWNRLRTLARARLGQHFDLRRFHDAALATGGVPLAVLADVVGDWIEQEAR